MDKNTDPKAKSRRRTKSIMLSIQGTPLSAPPTDNDHTNEKDASCLSSLDFIQTPLQEQHLVKDLESMEHNDNFLVIYADGIATATPNPPYICQPLNN